MHRAKPSQRCSLPAWATAMPAGVSLLVVGCMKDQSALHPAGPVARALAESWWVMFYGASAIFVAVMALALYAVYRSPEKRRAIDGHWLIAIGGVAFPVVTLTALLLYSVQLGDRAKTFPADALRIEVIGHQWWWEVRYPDYADAVTANEIHIPVGRPVVVELVSEDVIHSFWVPRLAGKMDLLPRQRNRTSLEADASGIYRGQCAEFCGGQHARMAFLVIAQPEAEFAEWLEDLQRPFAAPSTPVAARGLGAFVQYGCGECHTLRGHPAARGRMGPDLTHLAARRTLGAAILDNTPAHRSAWIVANQTIKPGNRMPPFDRLDSTTLGDLVAFLGALE